VKCAACNAPVDELVEALKLASNYVRGVASRAPTQASGMERQRRAMRDLRAIEAVIAKATGSAP
jgi:hypothetical protein